MYQSKHIKDFLKHSGIKRSPVILESTLSAKGFTSQQIETSLHYLDLLKNTNLFSKITRSFYIFGDSYDKIMKENNVNKGVVGNTITRETKRFFDLVGVDIFQEIKNNYGNPQTLAYYSQLLIELKNTYSEPKSDLAKQLVIDLIDYIPRSIEVAPEFKEEDLVNVLNRIQSLSRPYLELIFNSANPELMGYIKYLIDSDDSTLSPKDIETKLLIKKRLFLK